MTGSEDFSFVLEQVPGAFVMLGACPPDADADTAPFNHSAEAVFDDAVLADGTALVRRAGAAAAGRDAVGAGRLRDRGFKWVSAKPWLRNQGLKALESSLAGRRAGDPAEAPGQAAERRTRRGRGTLRGPRLRAIR